MRVYAHRAGACFRDRAEGEDGMHEHREQHRVDAVDAARVRVEVSSTIVMPRKRGLGDARRGCAAQRVRQRQVSGPSGMGCGVAAGRESDLPAAAAMLDYVMATALEGPGPRSRCSLPLATGWQFLRPPRGRGDS